MLIQLATNIRDAINNWNCGTNRWLRTIVYERVPKQYGTILTFSLSAVWHGFYPGYYLTFATGAVMVTSARFVSYLVINCVIRLIFVELLLTGTTHVSASFPTDTKYAHVLWYFNMLDHTSCDGLYNIPICSAWIYGKLENEIKAILYF